MAIVKQSFLSLILDSIFQTLHSQHFKSQSQFLACRPQTKPVQTQLTPRWNHTTPRFSRQASLFHTHWVSSVFPINPNSLDIHLPQAYLFNLMTLLAWILPDSLQPSAPTSGPLVDTMPSKRTPQARDVRWISQTSKNGHTMSWPCAIKSEPEHCSGPYLLGPNYMLSD